MKFRYTIIYVEDVEAVVNWYSKALGLEIKFLDESKMYGELATGETLLGFASLKMATLNLPDGYIRGDANKPAAFELAFINDDVKAALDKAVEAGAALIAEPDEKPWGQTVAFVLAPEGTLIEFATPMDQ